MVTCPTCGRENPEGFRLCGYCGAVLAPSSRETRKTVTVLFTDVTGSTGLGERLDPESLKSVMARYFATMRAVIDRHGGTVEKYIGDAVMAVFGVPVVHEDDALRAVRAAAEMRTALERLNVALLAEHGVELEARTGVNTGSVVVGSGNPAEAIVVGDAVNVAARLETAAAPGQILMGKATYSLVRDAVEAAPSEALELKGKTDPVIAYRLLAVAAQGVEGHQRHFDAPLIERERELEALLQAFERASATGSSQLFTILGAAGVGKSRLVAEFVSRVSDRARVLRGRCLPYGEGITYLPISEIVRQAAGIGEADTSDQSRVRIDALVAGQPEAAAMSRALAGLVGLETRAAGEELVWAFRRMLEQLAESGPLVVLVEDVHWAEPTLLDLLQSVADLTRDSPILFICPARPEFLDDRPTWGGGRVNATTILLEPLSAASANKLIDALVPGTSLSQAARARIAEGAEGNPLYVEEFVGMLIDDGTLVRSGDGWAATHDLESIAVPPTIQAVLAARLDRLEPAERQAAERASVVGRVFEQPAVVAITPPESRPEIPENLSSLVRKELIRADRSTLTPWETFRFRHMLIRDAAYERLPKSERAELHEKFAGWLSETFADRRAEFDEIAGYHLEQAFRYRDELGPLDDHGHELARQAALLLIAAGSRAFERSDAAGTANLYGRAAALLGGDDPIRLRILPILGRSLDEIGEYESAKAVFSDAIERASAAGDASALAHARIMRHITVLTEGLSADEMLRIADEASEAFEIAGDQTGLCRVWRLRGEAAWADGHIGEADMAFARALEFARLAGSHWDEASIVRDMSVDIYWGPIPLGDAIEWCRDIERRSPDDRGIEVGIAHALAHSHARLGDFELARTFATRCKAIAAESGLVAEATSLAEVAADVETLAGNYRVAERLYAEPCDSFIATGKPNALYEALHALAQVNAGDDVDVERLVALLDGVPDLWQALVNSAIAAARCAKGELEEAEAAARGALAYFEGTDLLNFHANACVILGDILNKARRSSDAVDAYRQALELYRRKGSIVDVQRVEARLS